jgi:hypothetical protein
VIDTFDELRKTLVGKTRDEAIDFLRNNEFFYRIIMFNGKPQGCPPTRYDSRRVNLIIVGKKISNIAIG